MAKPDPSKKSSENCSRAKPQPRACRPQCRGLQLVSRGTPFRRYQPGTASAVPGLCSTPPQWLEPVMRGSVSKVWNGGGEDTVHSKVVAPTPQGLFPARRFFAKASKMT